MPPTSAQQYFPSVPISVTYQCPSSCQSVPPVSAAHQCHQSVPISATYQCSIISDSSSMTTSAASPVAPHQSCLSMPPHQCPSVLPISAH
ncbi:unnamed protein product [Staurois parvus]|uniref:Uncharacterized protein n=1 Tax=Staurois parvus TaxID=386267 RepID=A0ABN9DSN6_9NEOB|nr:unnamed protein product [Staurois parvus]